VGSVGTLAGGYLIAWLGARPSFLVLAVILGLVAAAATATMHDRADDSAPA
jgi:hypothetical protein